jgi:hypothetical protein
MLGKRNDRLRREAHTHYLLVAACARFHSLNAVPRFGNMLRVLIERLQGRMWGDVGSGWGQGYKMIQHGRSDQGRWRETSG